MLNLLKGFIIGIGKIIPGVSGSVLAITLGVYDKSVEYINNFKHNKKESLKYLLPLGIGIIISIIIFSKIITILLDKYYQITMLFFIGLIIGGLPEIIKKVKKQDNINIKNLDSISDEMLKEYLVFSNYYATYSTTKKGAIASYANLEEIQEYIKNR